MSKSSSNLSIPSNKKLEEPKKITESINQEEVLKIKELNTDLINPNVNNYMDEKQGGHKLVIIGKPGTGKCLGFGTPILMYDGEIKQVQNIKAGDIIMGDDSTPRNVLTTCVGKETMYKIKQSNGMSYVANSPHILCLKDNKNNIIEITIQDYLNNLPTMNNLKGYKVDVDFEYKYVNINPYVLGTCHKLRNLNISIDDIKSNILNHLNYLKNNFRVNINNFESYTNNIYKQLYEDNMNSYKFNSKTIRNDYLSGLLDFYNILPYKYNGVDCYKLNFELNNDDKFIIESLGLTIKVINESNEKYILIFGTNLNSLNRKVNNFTLSGGPKDSLFNDYNLSNIEITLESIEDYYYGFQIDGNGRFLLEDFTVTHNTNLISSLLHSKKDIIPVAEIMSGTEDSNYFYRKIFPSLFVHNFYDEEQVDKFIKRQKIAKKHLANPWAVLLLDDCTDKPALFKKPLQQNLYKNGRHYKMLYILSLQYCMDVLPVIRTNVDGVFIMRETNLKNRHALYENYAGVIPDFNLFCDIMDQITNDYTALYIHNATTTNNWEECVFWYKAEQIDKKYPDFKFGCPDFWKFSEERFDKDYVDPI